MNSEALDRAIRFIDYRPRTGGETRARLGRWGYSAADSDEVVSHLKACGLIDDLEFGRLFVTEMIGKGFGHHRIRAELVKKKLDRQVIDKALGEYAEAEELDRAVGLAERLTLKHGDSERPESGKNILGYLMRRGYSRGIAAEACRIVTDVDTNIGPE